MSKLPKGWEIKSIKDLKLDISDGNYSSKYPTQNDFIECGVPFIRANNIKSMTVIDKDMRFISEKQHNELKKGHLKKNDILITTRGDIGQVALVPDKYISANINAQIVRIGVSESIFFKYLAYILTYEETQKNIKSLETGTALKQLPVKKLDLLNIPLPPLEEQKKIADILSTVDKKIAFVEENINATEELKKSLMQKLLTEGIGHTEFKDSELGRIPQSWEIVTLNNIISLLTDYHANGSYEKLKENVELLEKENYAVMIRTTNFENNDFENNLIYITEHAYDYLKKSKVNENDIVINKIANAGATYIMPKMSKPVSLAMNLFLLKLINTVDNKFVYLQIKKREENLKALASGTSTKTITKNDVKNFVIALAPIEEQKQIAEILSTVDKKLENLKEKKQSFEELKKGLMQKLLTGEVRV
ncbi:restriction endonuclease subunit S [Aliarcobacter butzleri]|uniref:restriction endonuclease subunit S n=1 Tax=Aliarcobacter butzleri TaxID=28197 RepID=UPI0021B15FDE|nr:restriction endonuclease subunit S [Aliarcobacter butzleri]MCT7584567.1 restriction endonuclease subunit S [Aliarcobacter butzleri]